MNFMEFASDHYVSLNLDHSFNGFILNKIPLVKKLQLREMVAVKILYGGISNENNPAHHKELFRLPEAASGIPYTYSLDKMPYVEASVGISNIFKLLRVELVKRFTYLDPSQCFGMGSKDTHIYGLLSRSATLLPLSYGRGRRVPPRGNGLPVPGYGRQERHPH
jgi:hypothetical protein